MNFKDLLSNKIFFFTFVIVVFGAVSVFAGSIIVNESGVRIEADNYFSSYGEEGITSNISFKGVDGNDYFLKVQNGLIVGIQEQEINYTFPTEGLVAYYKFDSINFTFTPDSTGKYNLTGINYPILNQSGIIENASSHYKGTHNYWSSISDIPISGDTSKTITIWYSKFSGISSIFYAGTSSSCQQFGLADFDSYLVALMNTESCDMNIINYPLNNNEWYFIAITYDSSTHNLSSYLNGELKNSTTRTLNTASGPLTFGLHWQSVATLWDMNGTIDEAGVWNRALTPNEITALYNNGEGLNYSN
ncbi:MAG: LamG domain-containing protein [Candidatus Pacearchaeota archaeon]|nr:LamG domain-containing protein [Candidatus Pacearchaeota archaeon]